MSAILDEVSNETAEELLAQARDHGLSVDDYLRTLLGILTLRYASDSDIKEFEADMQALAERNASPLPLDFSREDIYPDHD